MKKLLMAFCAFAVAFGAMAVEYQTEPNYRDGGITLTGPIGEWPSGNVAIPEVYNGNKVTALGRHVLGSGNSRVTVVTIPGSVRRIEASSMDDLRGLKTVVLSEGLIEIGKDAFYGCALTSIRIPSTVETMGPSAFAANPLTKIEVAEGSSCLFVSKDGKLLVDERMHKVLFCLPQASAVTIPEGVELIEANAFEQVSAKSITFPTTLKSLEIEAFNHLAGISEMDFSKTALEEVKSAAFVGSSVKTVRFPTCLKNLGFAAFARCSSLTSVYFSGRMPAIIHDWRIDEQMQEEQSICWRSWQNGTLGSDVYFFCDEESRAVPYVLRTVTTYVPRDKGWDDIVASGTWQGCPIKFADGEIPQGGDVDPGDWLAAHNFSGVVYDADENCVGMIQIATKKATKKGVGVSGTMMLQDGKKITLKNMTVAPEGGVLNVAWTVKGYGKLNVAIGAEGFSGQFEDGGSVESQELDEDTGVLKASITMTYIDKKTGKLKTKKITFGGFVSGGEGVGTAQAGKKDPIKDVEFTVR